VNFFGNFLKIKYRVVREWIKQPGRNTGRNKFIAYKYTTKIIFLFTIYSFTIYNSQKFSFLIFIDCCRKIRRIDILIYNLLIYNFNFLSFATERSVGSTDFVATKFIPLLQYQQINFFIIKKQGSLLELKIIFFIFATNWEYVLSPHFHNFSPLIFYPLKYAWIHPVFLILFSGYSILPLFLPSGDNTYITHT